MVTALGSCVKRPSVMLCTSLYKGKVGGGVKLLTTNYMSDDPIGSRLRAFKYPFGQFSGNELSYR